MAKSRLKDKKGLLDDLEKLNQLNAMAKDTRLTLVVEVDDHLW